MPALQAFYELLHNDEIQRIPIIPAAKFAAEEVTRERGIDEAQSQQTKTKRHKHTTKIPCGHQIFKTMDQLEAEAAEDKAQPVAPHPGDTSAPAEQVDDREDSSSGEDENQEPGGEQTLSDCCININTAR